MARIIVKTKFSVGQEVYVLRNASRKILTCSQCNSFRTEYHNVVAKAKIKDISFSGSARGKAQATQHNYTLSGSYAYNVNEKDIYATREEAEAKRGHKKKGIY